MQNGWGPWGSFTGIELEPLTCENIWFLNALDDDPRPKLQRHATRSEECRFNCHRDCSTSPCTCPCHRLEPNFIKAQRAEADMRRRGMDTATPVTTQLKCKRCRHTWLSHTTTRLPKTCARCHSKCWNRDRAQRLKCKRCGHTWLPRITLIARIPAQCPQCESRHWNQKKIMPPPAKTTLRIKTKKFTPVELVWAVEARGGHFRIDGKRVVITPGSAALRLQKYLIERKAEIVALLRARACWNQSAAHELGEL